VPSETQREKPAMNELSENEKRCSFCLRPREKVRDLVFWKKGVDCGKAVDQDNCPDAWHFDKNGDEV
jgi:hypothetical protein